MSNTNLNELMESLQSVQRVLSANTAPDGTIPPWLQTLEDQRRALVNSLNLALGITGSDSTSSPTANAITSPSPTSGSNPHIAPSPSIVPNAGSATPTPSFTPLAPPFELRSQSPYTPTVPSWNAQPCESNHCISIDATSLNPWNLPMLKPGDDGYQGGGGKNSGGEEATGGGDEGEGR
ncbi:hypothetical protein SISSUDRAFT_1031641 [Sistotremastrum suecicum HHB10207 ss-3]|uniref:Uncharacterized protein n=1 Tax=Sistotremastrum suecicum HHB10207 ss-3 TaxID=1314776 RepID=A0A166FQX7_9AGAM|nr:hypothetical protein SISSUDRAFT_1031641 [Sistotremastrum suecicum HHB10207 ss-3]